LLCHGMVCVVGRMRDLILQLSKSSIYSTKPQTVSAQGEKHPNQTCKTPRCNYVDAILSRVWGRGQKQTQLILL
ncbi:hypothetical protein L8O22_19695, partial [Enterobacter roggenkampii]|nr:hypothetical protein [Enterobacter roggenkampii]